MKRTFEVNEVVMVNVGPLFGGVSHNGKARITSLQSRDNGPHALVSFLRKDGSDSNIGTVLPYRKLTKIAPEVI